MNCEQVDICGKDWPTVTFVARFDFQFVNHNASADMVLAIEEGKNRDVGELLHQSFD